MPSCTYFVSFIPKQDVDEVPGSEPFFRTQYDGQRFSNRCRAIKNICGCFAQIAMPTCYFYLAKIFQQVGSSAFKSFGQAQ